MSSSEFVPTLAGIVMFIFGAALGAALLKGVLTSWQRRSWPVVEGKVSVADGPDGRRNALARISYVSPDGGRHTFETPTGTLGTEGLDGRDIPVSIDPKDPAHAIPRSGNGNLVMFGCFSVICFFFAVFGIFTLVHIFTH